MTLQRSAILSVAALLATSSAEAYDFGPPDGYAGNPFANQDCSVCHYSYPPNTGDGALQLIGLPAEFVPGQTYTLTVEIQDSGQKHWGFELCVVDDSDPGNPYVDGGILTVTDPLHTDLSIDGEGTLDYLKQTRDGAYFGVANGPVTWTFDWTAPGAGTEPSVTFYVAGNAANGDDTFFNDWIYTRQYQVYPTNPTATQATTWGQVKALYHSLR